MGVWDFFRGFFKDGFMNLKTCSQEVDINTKYKVLALESSIELISLSLIHI